MTVAGGLTRTFESIKEWIVKDLIKRQKPALDIKIDEMLKPANVQKIMVRELGLGKKIGKPLGFLGKGLSIARKVF